MACVVRDGVRDPAREEAPREDYDSQCGPDGPGAREGTGLQRAARGDVPHPRRRLRGEVREGPEHRRHGGRRGEELRPARARRVDGVAADAVRVRPVARPDRAADGDADPYGPQGPPPGGTGAPTQTRAAPEPASSFAFVSRLPLRRPAAGTVAIRGRHRPSAVLAGVERAWRRDGAGVPASTSEPTGVLS